MRRAEKCCNFASAIGKQRGAALKAGSRVPGGTKIENNDMMPQDKQRQSNRLDAAETREHEVKLGVHVNEIPTLYIRRPGQTKTLKIYIKIYN